jgi:hypothetical protein
MADGYGGREYTPVQKGVKLALYIKAVGRVTAVESASFVGCSLRHAYYILEQLAELLGLYKDGAYYVMME